MSRTVVTNPYRQVVARITPRRLESIPQSEILPGAEELMIKNNAGGYSFKLDPWKQLDRFLILGTLGGTYYVSERKLTTDNAKNIQELIKEDGLRVVRTVVEISEGNRAPKSDPGLFVLALCLSYGDTSTKREVISVLPRVARIGTHLFQFVQYASQFRGWGRSLREAVSHWYLSKDAQNLAYQVTKYQQRDGWSHRDLLRLAHTKAPVEEMQNVFKYIVKGEVPQPTFGAGDTRYAAYIQAVEAAKTSTESRDIVGLIHQLNLPRECIPTHFLKDRDVWEALLNKMPMTAMIRNLSTMSRVNLLTANSEAVRKVVSQLQNEEALRKSRIHPIALLSAMRVYNQGGIGYGLRSQHTDAFTPVASVSAALEEAFYASFGNIGSSGKRLLLGLDVSSSMGSGNIAGVPGLTPRDATAVMAMVTARSEYDGGNPLYTSMAFTSVFAEFPLNPKERLDDVCGRMKRMNFGGTDCALPIKYAMANKIPVDTFIIYTDNETWAGNVHVNVLLDKYRQTMGIPAKMITVGFTATNISIADPRDAGMLDVVGFDTSTPDIIRGFSTGAF